MAADETRPAGINNEPGVATAECAEPTVDTSHTADQTLQCCSQPLLQITRETPYSHYPEHTAAHYCRESGEYTGDCHSGDNWHLSWDVRRLLYFISVTKLSPENWWHLPYLLTSPPVTVSLTSSHSSSHHYYYPALAIRKACNYKIGSQDDRKSSTNQNLDRSFKRQNGMVLISPPILFSHKTIVSLW